MKECDEFSENEHCASNIDHNRASRVSKISEKNRPIIFLYATVHTVNCLELKGSFSHAFCAYFTSNVIKCCKVNTT